ncbi:MAG: class I tRNA ligase family protein, partial [Candidatus Omnitrophica bacterium]|nr:class I tRNA ligase family protein [Candidatus Omnitrophota bacterium]
VHRKGVIVAKTTPSKCSSCGGKDLTQDEDVLDTWFSSWLWPISTLGWPKKTKDLDYFYPTNTLVTAQEIIFFWVARMIMAGYFCMKQPPFTQVYIHGTVRDITGKKMSKSLGNIIDPLEIIGQYGTDALRYTLVTATAIGQDIVLSEERFVAGRNFANKLWNATRYVLSQGEFGIRSAEFWVKAASTPHSALRTPHSLSVADRWILSRLQRTITRVTKSLDQFLFNDAANALYDFLWHDFCDWYLEISKFQLSQNQKPPSVEEIKKRIDAVLSDKTPPIQDPRSQTLDILVHVLETSLRLLHPVMPFITEELWQHLTQRQATSDKQQSTVSIMTAAWPKASSKLIDEEAEEAMEQFQAVVGAIRNTRAELNLPLDSRPAVRLVAKQPKIRQFFDAHRPLLQALAQVGETVVEAAGQRPKDAAAMVVDGIEVLIPLAGLIDTQKERARLQQRVEELTKQLAQTEARLKDKRFTGKAPKEVVEQTKARRTQIQDTLKKFSDHLAVLQSM